MSGRRRSGTRTFVYVLLFIIFIALLATGITFLILALLPAGSTGGQTGFTGFSGASGTSFVASSLFDDSYLKYDATSLNNKTVYIRLAKDDKSLAVSGGCGVSTPTMITTSTKVPTDIRDRWKLQLVASNSKATFYLIPNSACVPLKLSAFTCGNTNGTYLASANDVSLRRYWQIIPTQPDNGTYQIKLVSGVRGSTCSEIYLTGASNSVQLSSSPNATGWSIIVV